MEIIEYILPITAFLAVTAALIGGTWDKDKRGIDKLTPIGRYTLTIAVIALLVSSLNISNSQNEKKKLKKEKADMRYILNSISIELGNHLIDNSRSPWQKAIPAGSIIRTLGFNCNVDIITELNTENIMSGENSEVAVRGIRKTLVPVTIILKSNNCSGKIFITGTANGRA